VFEGEEIRSTMENAHHEIGGFFQGLRDQKVEAVPIFTARALPYGTVSSSAYTKLIEKMFFLTKKAGKLDGYLVAPHGATVSDKYPDADGHWLYKLRQRVGSGTPIIGTLDLPLLFLYLSDLSGGCSGIQSVHPSLLPSAERG
jgi:microcystin degradation protein MlrC